MNDKFNFFTFKESFFTLFRISTGEDWQAIMIDLYEESKYGNDFIFITVIILFIGVFVTQVFFILFIILMTFVMLNLFMLVLV